MCSPSYSSFAHCTLHTLHASRGSVSTPNEPRVRRPLLTHALHCSRKSPNVGLLSRTDCMLTFHFTTLRTSYTRNYEVLPTHTSSCTRNYTAYTGKSCEPTLPCLQGTTPNFLPRCVLRIQGITKYCQPILPRVRGITLRTRGSPASPHFPVYKERHQFFLRSKYDSSYTMFFSFPRRHEMLRLPIHTSSCMRKYTAYTGKS